MDTKIVCFGEMLWDMLPTGKMPGGAPLNVAIHLKYQGFEPVVISKVGADDPGKELMQFMQSKQVSTAFIQYSSTHLTGLVQVNTNAKGEATYKIVEPVAWDFIQPTAEIVGLVTSSDLFIYGSLAARRENNYETLLLLLQKGKRNVFDVNLRPPHYTRQKVESLLKFAHILKLNHHELAEIGGWFCQEKQEKELMQCLRHRFGLELLIVTRGANGAIILHNDGFFEHAGFSVTVKDTVGSGDAFLATFLSQYLSGETIPEALKRACAMGALVATRQGATPVITEAEVAALVKHD